MRKRDATPKAEWAGGVGAVPKGAPTIAQSKSNAWLAGLPGCGHDMLKDHGTDLIRLISSFSSQWPEQGRQRFFPGSIECVSDDPRWSLTEPARFKRLIADFRIERILRSRFVGTERFLHNEIRGGVADLMRQLDGLLAGHDEMEFHERHCSRVAGPHMVGGG
jgi:hypothetical protein